MVTPGSLIGPYRIERLLGQGGMAAVYLAHDDRLDRQVAIKVIMDHRLAEPSFQERLRREARAAARLRHPDIVTVHDFVETENVRAIVMEYVPGGTLRDRIGGATRVDEVVRLLAPIADALDYAHQQGFIHRDIKPANILIRENGRTVLSDFGLVRLSEAESGLTATGMTAGTPEYIAPEQALGQTVGPQVDVFSLAVIAYEMLCGAQPYEADTPVALLVAHAYQDPRRPRAVEPALSPEIENILLKGLARNPAERYQTAGEFIDALAAAGSTAGARTESPATVEMAGVPPPPLSSPVPSAPAAPPPSAPGPASSAPAPASPAPAVARGGRGKTWAIVGGIAVLALAAIGGTFAMRGDDEQPGTPTATSTPTRAATAGNGTTVGDPAEIVVQAGEVTAEGLKFQGQQAMTLDSVFLESTTSDLDSGELETLSRGEGIVNTYDTSDPATVNFLVSGAFVFPNESDAEDAIGILEPLLLDSSNNDPEAIFQVTQSVPFDPPNELGSDAVAVAEFGTVTGTSIEIQGYTTAWRQGRIVSILLYIVSIDADANQVSSRYFRWLLAQNGRMTG